MNGWPELIQAKTHQEELERTAEKYRLARRVKQQNELTHHKREIRQLFRDLEHWLKLQGTQEDVPKD